jgi:uncharacterized protein
MKNKLHLMALGVVLGMMGLILFYSFADSSDHSQYIKKIKQQRLEKDRWMLSKESPLSDSAKKGFKTLSYFDPDFSYRIEAELERFEVDSTLTLRTSTAEEQTYRRYGKAVFVKDGKKVSLTLLQPTMGMKLIPRLFVPFVDQSSGEESYEGGRYLETEMPDGNTLILDFNQAYNPYCTYNKTFSCPIPPRENFLPIRILAGERTFKF